VRRKTPAECKAERAARRSSLAPLDRLPVTLSLLTPSPILGLPQFVQRGCNVDEPFTCRDCGRAEVWTALQQKWWFEVAHGDIWTQAIRCRPCRARERLRRAEARRVHLEGLAAKHLAKLEELSVAKSVPN